MSQLALGGLPTVHGVGDHLDRCYTPLPLAAACVEVVREVRHDLGYRGGLMIEPSVGAGAFLRAHGDFFQSVAVDIDPSAEGLTLAARCEVGDWLQVARSFGFPGLTSIDVILGNPPFSGDTAIPHVETALDLRPGVVALILPLDFMAVDRWAHLMDGARRPRLVCPIRPRPWGDRVRSTALYIHTPHDPVSRTMIRPLVWR